MDVIKDYLIFGNVDNRDYGIEIFFKDVDHIPKRVYERIEVPGRNGAVLIDEGRYEDVPVTYDCIALNDADRSEFVNALASQTGYQRMQDSFNNGEFYSAVFEGDVDPNVTKDRAQSTFSIYFTRAPQRYLISGETKLTVNSGDILTNPTLFESSPMLEVEGHGTIAFNGYEIELENAVMGDLTLSSPTSYATPFFDVKFQKSLFNIGDTITLKGATINWYVSVNGSEPDSLVSISHTNNKFSTPQVLPKLSNPATTTISEIAYSADTNAEETDTMTVIVTKGGTNYTLVVETRIRFYTTQYISEYRLTFGATKASGTSSGTSFAGAKARQSGVEGYSTVSILGNPTYMDCDLGEVYMIKDGSPISLNAYVDLGSDLPKLGAGENEITFDNTVTDLKVVPRWWKV